MKLPKLESKILTACEWLCKVAKRNEAHVPAQRSTPTPPARCQEDMLVGRLGATVTLPIFRTEKENKNFLSRMGQFDYFLHTKEYYM